MKQAIAKADVLLEAMPYLRAFAGKTFVIKYGGSIQDMPGGEESVVCDILFLQLVGIKPVVVHGGGREISEAQKKRGLQPHFVQGLRVTCPRTMRVISSVLGKINRRIVRRLRAHGQRAAGFSGLDGAMVRARKLKLSGRWAREDLGRVGEISGFFLPPLRHAQREESVPIVSSVAVGKDGELYNVNADEVAGALAGRLRAAKLILMTDVSGIQDGSGRLLSSLSSNQAGKLIAGGVISRGMIPKVRSCLSALARGVGKAHIIDGRLRHSMLLEIFTAKGIGTQILK